MASFNYNVVDELKEAVLFDYKEDVRRILSNVRRSSDQKRLFSAFSYMFVWAIEQRNDSMVRLLKQEGIQITAVALETAARMGSLSMLRCLLELGWGINKPLGVYNPPILHLTTCHHDLVVGLLELGADPNANCDIDLTPLSFAAKEASLETLRLLIQHAKCYSTGLQKGQLMHFAVQRRSAVERLEVIKMLAENGAPIDLVQYQDQRSIRLRGHFTLGTPLYSSCLQDDPAAAKVLLELGADPDKSCRKMGKIVNKTPRQLMDQSSLLKDLL